MKASCKNGEWGMYQIGEKVVYGIHGVCVVINQEEQVVNRKRVTYLVLEPIGQEGSRYLIPTHNTAAMAKLRRVLTKMEFEELICSERVHTSCWIQDENQRKQAYRELISGGEREKLMQMTHTLYRYKAAQAATSRKFHLCDENFLRDAEKLLAGEAALILELDADAARQYIRSKLKEDA